MPFDVAAVDAGAFFSMEPGANWSQRKSRLIPGHRSVFADSCVTNCVFDVGINMLAVNGPSKVNYVMGMWGVSAALSQLKEGCVGEEL